MTDAGVVEGDVLDPAAGVLLAGVDWVQLPLDGGAPLPLGVGPGARRVHAEPVGAVRGHLHLLVHVASVPGSQDDTW